ncbi:MAG: L-seryl-tRNA(Sec) selenium transferase [Anaerolineales bacterium]
MTMRDLPSVDFLLQSEAAEQLAESFGRGLLKEAVRESLDQARTSIREGSSAPSEEQILESIASILSSWTTATLQPVINASGVILHTNLGRAPLSTPAQDAISSIASGYSNLEYDLRKGKRGKRDHHAEALLRRLTGAEAALVVNNNASAVLLALTALARRKEVLISRSQLIEIGGGFRIPDVMKQSGAKLVEIGTTNRTHIKDFEAAIHERTGMILRAHHSNFKIIGFTTEPSLEELSELGEQYGVPVLDDIGSGALLDTSAYGLGHEPMVQESLQGGAALVAFSGDKLLGGPQAGILVGRKDLIDRLKRHPLARAIRPDKLCLAALSATLLSYLTEREEKEIPVWQMISVPEAELKARVEGWITKLGQGEPRAGRSTVGGGSLPEETLPTWLLAFRVKHPDATVHRLREGDPPIVARIEDDLIVIDSRTVLVHQEEDLLTQLSRHIQEMK